MLPLKLKCPHCGHSFNADHALKEQLQPIIEKDLKSKLLAEKSKMEQLIRREIGNEKSHEVLSLQRQLKERLKESKDYNRIKADLIRIKRESEMIKEQAQADAEEKLTLLLNQEKQKLKKDIQDKAQLKIAERDHMINQLNDQLKKAQQRIEQRSMEAQGESSEIALTKLLLSAYPSDELSEVAKGAMGADLILTIRNKNQQPCGVIAIESKNTRSFSNSWISKLKGDQRRHRADLALLITEVLPKNFSQFGCLDGVWICQPGDAVALIFVLRESLLKIHEVKSAGENKQDKVHMLYSYLTNEEFARQIRCVIECFSSLKSNLDKEKKSMMQIWKDRERMIDEAATSAIEIVSEVKSIAGSGLKLLETESLPLLPSKFQTN